MESKALIIGDTSKFHIGSKANYSEFRKLVRKKYEITGEIPYDAFGTQFEDFRTFFSKFKKSRWWEEVENSDILIVHGEGLTEKYAAYTYYYLYFSKIAKRLGIKSHLVNCSMYESDPYLCLVRDFDYIASRDILTKRHLQSRGIYSELSLDCSILSSEIPAHSVSDGHVALIRGRNTINEDCLEGIKNIRRYDCCWKWDKDQKAVKLPAFHDYIAELKRARFSMTTSFHANITSCLAGIPFISMDFGNPKYIALDLELLPKEIRDPAGLMGISNRKEIYNHYKSIYPKLVSRAKLNVV